MRSILVFTLSAISFLQMSAQSSDSLQLKQLLKEVIDTHPSIKEASEALTVADARIAMAKSEYLPNVDGNASYSYIGPVSSITLPSVGTFQLFPQHNYSASINYNQVLYNFGKTAQNVKTETESRNATAFNINILKQKLTSVTVNSFYALVYVQEALRIKNTQIETLKEHISFLEKKLATGSARRYDLLSSKVRLSTAESQRIDLLSAQRMQSALINSLTGKSTAGTVVVKKDVLMQSTTSPIDTLLNIAYTHRAELSLAVEKEKLASLHYEVVKMQNRPVLNGFASAGGKNGYIPDEKAVKFNYVAGLGLKVPLYDANRKKNSLILAQSTINNLSFETELAKRTITTEVIENQTNCEASHQKLQQFELQVEQATEAYNLAKTNFNVGAITNLDLLDAETSVSESRLYLLKSKIDYELNLLKLKISLGQEI